MSVQTGQMTVQEFERLAAQPDNANRRLQYIGREAVEIVSNSYSSLVAARILARLLLYVEEHDLGYVTGADGGYMVSGERYIPDVGFITRQKQPEPPRETWISSPPNLVVEVMSPPDDPEAVRIKVVNYLHAGVTVWLVNPDKQQVEVYQSGQPVRKVTLNGTLDGGDLLPGFRLMIKHIFPEKA